MLMSDFTKRSFTGGELSPSLRSRIDLNKFQVGLAKCLNFMVLPEGGVVNRPGFELIDNYRNYGYQHSFLVPFQFNQNDSYMLAFSDSRLQVYRYGERVRFFDSPYSYEEMTEAQTVQNQDVIIIAHINHPLRTLTRVASDNWDFDEVSFSATQSPPTALVASTTGTNSESDKKTYEYVVTSVINGVESGQSNSVSINTNALSQTWGVQLNWSGSADSFNIYKSASASTNVFGWIGNSKTNSFSDFNIAPVTSEGITQQTNPFNVVNVELDTTSGSLSVGQSISNTDFTGEILRKSGDVYTLTEVTGMPVVGGTVESSRVQFTATGDIEIGNTLTAGANEGIVVGRSGASYLVDMIAGSFSNGDALTITGSTIALYRVDIATGDPELVAGNTFTALGVVTGTIANVGAVIGGQQNFTSTDIVGSLSVGDNVEVDDGAGNNRAYNIANIDFTDITGSGVVSGNPVPAYVGSITDVDDVSNPSVVSFYQQRLMLANTEEGPQTVYGSRTSSYFDYRVSEPTGDSDSLEFTIASGQVNEIRHILSMGDMLLLTSSGVWRVTEGQNEVLTPASVGVRRISNYGASKLRPLLVGSSALFVEAKGARVRDVYALQNYESDDLSILARHLFHGHTIISWCYQEDPHGIIWAVRSDGKLLGLTYHKGHQVWGWHVHETQGSFVSVACVTETSVDSVYACIERDGEYNIERLSQRMDDAYDNFTFLDSYHKETFDSPVDTVTRPAHLEGKAIKVLADGFVYKFNETAPLVFSRPVSNVLIGLGYESDLETLNVDPEGANTNGKVLQVTKLSLAIKSTVSGYLGQSFDNLYPAKWRTPDMNYGPLEIYTGDYTQIMGAGWGDHGKVCIRQSEPLPMHILSITPTVLMGGR